MILKIFEPIIQGIDDEFKEAEKSMRNTMRKLKDK